MNKKEREFKEDILRVRGISFAEIGMMIEVCGDIGTIVGLNNGGNLNVRFANELKHKGGLSNCSPTWEIRYFDKNNEVIADYREKAHV